MTTPETPIPRCGVASCRGCSVCIHLEQQERNRRRFGRPDYPGGNVSGEWSEP